MALPRRTGGNMQAHIRIVAATTINIKDLKPHPLNARRGDVTTIVESLSAHGQIEPIVIDPENTILAGHHVVQAAKKLGWTKIAAVIHKGSSISGRRILLADNRTADLATYDETALRDLLASLDTLAGTGYTQTDIDELDAIIGGDTPPPDPAPPTEPDPELDATIKIGPLFQYTIPRAEFMAWEQNLPEKKPAAIRQLKETLGIPEPEPTPPTPTKISTPLETVPINELTPHPRNVRQGDTGAIVESLVANGQYRPIVVNRGTKHILVGNHRWEAARALGWDKIAVNYVDVPEEHEIPIMLMHNRTSDLATYDIENLRTLLTSIKDLTGTGYLPEDVAEIIQGTAKPKPGPPPTGRTTIKIDTYTWRAHTHLYNEWAQTHTPESVAVLLNLPTTPVT